MQNKTKPKNLQDVFNRVWKHFIIQKYGRSVNKYGNCTYRSTDRNAPACAIGCMLTDKMARNLDKETDVDIESVVKNHPDVRRRFSNIETKDLTILQNIHDYQFSNLRNALIDFAKKRKLEVPRTNSQLPAVKTAGLSA